MVFSHFLNNNTRIVILDSNRTNFNLQSEVNLINPIPLRIIVQPGVIIGGSGSSAAFNVGTMPMGTLIYLLNYGSIIGFGGPGGAGGGQSGSSQYSGHGGSTGGTAILTTKNILVDNRGLIAGGGGGGGGGGIGCVEEGKGTEFIAPGGSGGTGAGPFNTSGGGNSGVSSGGYNSGGGGAGGSLGTSGGSGGTGTTPHYDAQCPQPGGGGGSSGFYVNGNSFITWINTGTRLGRIVN